MCPLRNTLSFHLYYSYLLEWVIWHHLLVIDVIIFSHLIPKFLGAEAIALHH